MTPHEQKAQALLESLDMSPYLIINNQRKDVLLETILHHFPEPVEKVCRWTPVVKSGGMSKPSCCDIFADNVDFKFCPFCGGKIV